MSDFDWKKAGLALVGVATWAYGVRSEAAPVQWLGIGFVAAAFLLRFVGRRDREEQP